jgi:hypothetical protein
MEDFQRMLNDDQERDDFKELLVTEFAVENLLLWEKIEDLSGTSDLQEKCFKGLQIIQTFCLETSKLEINLPHSLYVVSDLSNLSWRRGK